VTDAFTPAPRPAHRLIASQFPPIGLFDTVATAADLAAVMELVGWTNDRLVADRIARLPAMTRTYRAYAATLLGDYLDIRGQQSTRAEVYASERYDASQKLGEEVRASGSAGLLYDSLRRRTGSNVVAHRPRNITDILQTDHFEISVLATSRTVDVRKLSR